jgi:hypothetical protein
LMVPCDVSAVKLGASSFIRNIVFLLMWYTLAPALKDLLSMF